MRQIHHLWMRVYCKPEDNEQEIEDSLRKFFPFNIEEQRLKIEKLAATGFEERKIIILQLHLEKASHINKFISALLENLNKEQKSLLLRQRESRLDAENHFYIRFDKDRLIRENRFFITDDGNCFHLKMSISAFPPRRENALKVIEEIFIKR